MSARDGGAGTGGQGGHPGGTSAAPDAGARRWRRLAAQHARQGDLDAALDAYTEAAAEDPADLAAHEGLARLALGLQDLERARTSADMLVRRFPDAPFTHLFAGHLAKALGKVSDAASHYRQALALDPAGGEALYSLVEMDPPAADHPLSLGAARLAADQAAAAPDRINTAFACARILDAASDYARAIAYLRQANELARATLADHGIVYEPHEVEAQMRRRIDEYPAAGFAAALAPLAIDIQPIFIIGLPRSGTTLLEQILASHRDVDAGGELLLAPQCEADFSRRRAAAGRRGAVDPADPVDATCLARARERYLDGLFERGLDGEWVVDKLPANFEIAGFLRQMFPHAPIVHSMRDPRATCFSLYAANFAAHEPWYHDLDHLAHYHGVYRRLMTHWRAVLPAPFVEIVYEELVKAPEAGIRALLDALGLGFDPACMNAHAHQRPILTASHAAVRRPIHERAIDHWRHYAVWLGAVNQVGADGGDGSRAATSGRPDSSGTGRPDG